MLYKSIKKVFRRVINSSNLGIGGANRSTARQSAGRVLPKGTQHRIMSRLIMSRLIVPRLTAPRLIASRLIAPNLALMLLAMWLLSACSLSYFEGNTYQKEERWIQAEEKYNRALAFPNADVATIEEQLSKVRPPAALMHLEEYQRYLAAREYHKAFESIEKAHQADAQATLNTASGTISASAEWAKWYRVLLIGRVVVTEFMGLTLRDSDAINFVLRLDTPTLETVDADMDFSTGLLTFESVIYDPLPQQFFMYTLRDIGLKLVFEKSSLRQYSSTELLKMVSFPSSTIDIQGNLRFPQLGDAQHKVELADIGLKSTYSLVLDATNRPAVSFVLEAEQEQLKLIQPQKNMTMPARVYINPDSRHVLVDFGQYRLEPVEDGLQWLVSREEGNYVTIIAKNIALQPYLYYRGNSLLVN